MKRYARMTDTIVFVSRSRRCARGQRLYPPKPALWRAASSPRVHFEIAET